MPPVSVLDLSPVAAGAGEAQALRETVELARHADRLGFHRYWLAEHHGGGMVAGRPERMLVGSPLTVRDRADELLGLSGADELMAMTNVHDAADRIRSYELLAEAFTLKPREAARLATAT